MKKTLYLLLASMLLIPAWVSAACSVDINITRPNTLYIDHGNGTVTDTHSGLMWQKCSLGLSGNQCQTGTATTTTWLAAFTAVSTNNGGAGTSGYTDWRLPSVVELKSLAEHHCMAPAINSTIFPATVSANPAHYWTSTATPGVSLTNARIVDFYNGSVSHKDRASTAYVRLVRGGE